MKTREVRVGNVRIGGKNPIALIAGPCVIESEASALRHAKLIKGIAKKLNMPFIYKSSFDKANRTSIKSYRGPGIDKGLKILARIKKELKVPILSDIHCQDDIKKVLNTLDVIQIPAFLSRQTDLITKAAKTGKVINIKKGQFLAPWDIKHIIEKVESAGNKNMIFTERGTSFGYNTLVSDFRSMLIMKKFGYPVIFDATHSVQSPGGKGDRSGGDREFVEPLALASLTCGADAIFMEVHEDPDNALSDGPNMFPLDKLESFLKKLKRVEIAVGR
ncbi:MAG: 3-deoxy-8-phosphooctulonate synthase [Candidatus Omnitrophica bacterium]|nr:3-deoxy-8-phosphooctulonate synthase [Candidatus Omnitrophota bacterium]